MSIIFKAGNKGSKVDNASSGGFVVGVKDNGELFTNGFGLNGTTTTNINGLELKNCVFNDFDKITNFAISEHSRVPHIHIIGWDIALDENDDTILIEANAIWPGITLEQLCPGPIFGDRTQEVIDYCKKNRDLLPKRLFYV